MNTLFSEKRLCYMNHPSEGNNTFEKAGDRIKSLSSRNSKKLETVPSGLGGRMFNYDIEADPSMFIKPTRITKWITYISELLKIKNERLNELNKQIQNLEEAQKTGEASGEQIQKLNDDRLERNELRQEAVKMKFHREQFTERKEQVERLVRILKSEQDSLWEKYGENFCKIKQMIIDTTARDDAEDDLKCTYENLESRFKGEDKKLVDELMKIIASELEGIDTLNTVEKRVRKKAKDQISKLTRTFERKLTESQTMKIDQRLLAEENEAESPLVPVLKSVRKRLKNIFGMGLNIIPNKAEAAKVSLIKAKEEIEEARREHADYQTGKDLDETILSLLKTLSQPRPISSRNETVHRISTEKLMQLYTFVRKLKALIKAEKEERNRHKYETLMGVIDKIFLIGKRKTEAGMAFDCRAPRVLETINVEILSQLKETEIMRVAKKVTEMTDATLSNREINEELKFLGLDGDKVMALVKSIIKEHIKSSGQTDRYDKDKLYRGLDLGDTQGEPAEGLSQETTKRQKIEKISTEDLQNRTESNLNDLMTLFQSSQIPASIERKRMHINAEYMSFKEKFPSKIIPEFEHERLVGFDREVSMIYTALSKRILNSEEVKSLSGCRAVYQSYKHLERLIAKLDAEILGYDELIEKGNREDGLCIPEGKRQVPSTTVEAAIQLHGKWKLLHAELKKVEDRVGSRITDLRSYIQFQERSLKRKEKNGDLSQKEMPKRAARAAALVKTDQFQIIAYALASHITLALEKIEHEESLSQKVDGGIYRRVRKAKQYTDRLQSLQVIISEITERNVTQSRLLREHTIKAVSELLQPQNLQSIIDELNTALTGAKEGVNTTKEDLVELMKIIPDIRRINDELVRKFHDWYQELEQKKANKMLDGMGAFLLENSRPLVRAMEIRRRMKDVQEPLPDFDQIENLRKSLRDGSIEINKVGIELSTIKLSQKEDHQSQKLKQIKSKESQLKQAQQEGNQVLVERLRKEIEGLKEEKEEKDKEIVALKGQLEKLTTAAKAANISSFTAPFVPTVDTKQVEELQGTITELKEKGEKETQELVELRSQLSGEKNSVQNLKKERDACKAKISALEDELKEKKEQLEKIKSEMQERTDLAQEHLEKSALLEAEIITLKEKRASAEKQLAQKDEEISFLSVKANLLDGKNEELTTVKAELNIKSEDLEEAISQKNARDMSIADLEQKLASSIQALEEEKTEVNRISKELEDKKTLITELQDKVSSLNHHIEIKNAKSEGIDEANHAALHKEINELKSKLEEALETLKKQQRRINAFIRGGKTRDKNQNERKKQLKEIRKALGLKEREVEEISLEKNLVQYKLQKERDEHDMTFEELERKSDELEKLYEGESEEMTSHLSDIKVEIEKKSVELNELYQKVGHLDDQLHEVKERLKESESTQESLQDAEGHVLTYMTTLNCQSAQLLHGSQGLEAWIEQRSELKIKRRGLSQEITKLQRIKQNEVKVKAMMSIISQLKEKQSVALQMDNTERAEKLNQLMENQQKALEKTQRSVQKTEKIPELEKQLKQVDLQLTEMNGKIKTALEFMPSRDTSSPIIDEHDRIRGRVVAIVKTLLDEQLADTALLDKTSEELPKSSAKTFTNLAGQWQREVDREQALYELASTHAELDRIKKELEWAKENPKEFLRARMNEMETLDGVKLEFDDEEPSS